VSQDSHLTPSESPTSTLPFTDFSGSGVLLEAFIAPNLSGNSHLFWTKENDAAHPWTRRCEREVLSGIVHFVLRLSAGRRSAEYAVEDPTTDYAMR
jgi:hypothetical protein